jgi:uncharacterized protein (DUF305 family)
MQMIKTHSPGRFVRHVLKLNMYVFPAFLLFFVFPVPDLPASGQDDHMMMNVESEYDFLLEMIPHHQEAVDSSLVVVKRTSREVLAEFADNIVRVQEAEIAQMRQWLSSWYPDRNETADYQPMMKSTSRLTSDQADERYLKDMIKHHQMAVVMAESVLSGDLSERPEVLDFARGIVNTQNSEIRQMEIWLDEILAEKARILKEKQEKMKNDKPDATSGASPKH